MNIPKIPQNYHDLYDMYGDPSSAQFESIHIVTTPHTLADGKQIHIQSHKSIVPMLHEIFLTCHHLIHTYDGCYVVRDVRGSNTHLSLHSWGLAIDLNASQYPLGSPKRQNSVLIDKFVELGFWYGGNFHHRPDPMHFQFAGDF